MSDSADGRSEINRRLMQVIQHAIERDGLTRRDLEHMAGASSPTVSDWFNRAAVPDAATIGKLCRGLHVNAHWVITGQGPKSPPGEGKEKADQLFALGAAAVLHDLRELLGKVEAGYSPAVLSHGRAIQEALADLEQEDRRASLTPERRRSARKRRKA